MDTNTRLPRYEDAHSSHAPNVAGPPDYGKEYSAMTLTFDPSGLSIEPLPTEHPNVPVHYTLTSSMLEVNLRTAIQVKRILPSHEEKGTESNNGEPSSVAVYVVGDTYMKPLHTRNPKLQKIMVERSTGLFVAAGVKKQAYEFCISVPVENLDVRKSVDPIVVLGASDTPTVIRRHLIQYYDSKWLHYPENVTDGEIIAFEREGNEQSKGMPMLNIVKSLNEEMMDFLVSAWCVKLWQQGDKIKHSRRKFSPSS